MDPTADLRPKKHFGQHFLVSAPAIRTIVQEALASPAAQILEVGPGPGVLTEGLLADGRPLLAVDLDTEAIAHLQARWGSVPHFRLLEGDAVTVPLPEIEGAWSVVGNLPYNAATAILTRFLVEPIPWERMVLMFQLEVGQKLLGRPGEKSYGPLSVLAQECCHLQRLLRLGPGAFRPAPKVDSAVLRFEPRADALPMDRRRAFLDFLHRSFAHRRKTLANNWSGWIPPDEGRVALEAQKLAPTLRPEALAPRQWRALFESLPSLR